MQRRKADLPEWARQIFDLRERLGLSQASLGARLHYSAMAISRWERGTKEPPAQCWIQLGNLAGDPECWLFWSRAGLRSADISRILPEGRSSRVKGSSMNRSIFERDIVAVDSAQTDPSKLSSKIIVAWHREHGLSLARFRRVDGMQMLESENRDYEPILLSKDRSWRIVGRVLWWIRQAP